jgi:dienelactone hydrolase
MGGHRRYIGLLAGAGYAVLIPDSFARKGRLKSGDPKRHRGIAGAPFKRIMEMRLEEIRYATEQAGRFPWVDKENLFLMGHSQGGRRPVFRREFKGAYHQRLYLSRRVACSGGNTNSLHLFRKRFLAPGPFPEWMLGRSQ